MVAKEAAQLLRPMLRELGENDLVFGSTEIVKHAKINSQATLRNALDRTGLNMKYETTGRYVINTHSFRAYGITKISRHDPNFAKKLAGQKGYLLQYDRMSDEDKLEKYLELESELLVFDESKKNAEIENLKKKNSKMESDYAEALTSVSDRMLNLEKELSELKSNSN